MRKVGSGRGQITAYPRQLESLIRLSECHAKMRFSHTVELRDVEEAHRLHREALKQSATDPMSGKIDVSILTTGQSSGSRKRRAEVAASLKVGTSFSTIVQRFALFDIFGRVLLRRKGKCRRSISINFAVN